MPGKFVQLTIDVLTQTGKRMTAKEVWDYAKDGNHDVSFTKGETPWETLRSRVYFEIQNNPHTLLRAVGEHPRKFYINLPDDKLKPSPEFEAFERKVQSSAKQKPEVLLQRIRNRRSAKPKRHSKTVEVFDRDPDVVAYVRLRAKFRCEMPGCQSPRFQMDNGVWFVEVHHLKPLGEGGDDTPENTAALCPNCHRWLNFGNARAEQLRVLKEALARKTASAIV